MDRRAFGADRSWVLRQLFAYSCAAPRVAASIADSELKGFVLAREGSRATYVGPLVASDSDLALELLDAILADLSSRSVYFDFHTGCLVSRQALLERGFTNQLRILRMRFGKQSPAGDSEMVFGIGGPEVA